ncbi:MAG: Lrp/AsnC ligand binding domain-containing protein [Candidatus Methylarchaceae archaeon HK02M1]|nr:Lrp/AsnC ligand binding domain-containing protein [Candidatus Methylarchaceae archaeon HK02M1]
MSLNKILNHKALRAFIMVTMKPGTASQMIKSNNIKGLKMANSVLGRFDAVLVIEAESIEELKRNIYEIIDQHPDVVHTETLISISNP